MKRWLYWLGLWGGMVVASWMQSAAAQTVSTDRYQFLPKLSVLNQTGGFAGVDVDFRVMGRFDFNVETGPTDVWPIEYVANFTNVNAWASHPILAYVMPLDQTLNLSELTGRQLPVAAPFDVYRFDGKTDDGSTVELYAAQIGPWLHLRGTTEAPQGSADYFEYELKAVARRLPFADFDGSDAVDAGDLAKWSSRFGLKSTTLDGLSEGDVNGDGVADGADFLQWQRQVGEVAPTLASLDAMVDAALATATTASTASVVGVPEPSAAALGLLGSVAIIRRRRR